MILAALALAASQPSQPPRDFIAHVYAQYRHNDFSPLAHPDRFFSPALAAAIRKDASGGEVGYLDGDPLCDCQDYGHLSADIRSLSPAGRRAATARVHVTLDASEARDLELALVLTRAGWRIADVVGPDHHSLLRELQRSNASRWPHRRSPRKRT